MQEGLTGFLKQVGFITKFFKLYISSNVEGLTWLFL